MNTAIYLSLREDESFHTIIIKKVIGDFTYLAAVGYEGGGEYAEFYGKFWYEPDAVGQVHAVGYFSGSTGSGEWENKLTALKFNNDRERFDAETEDLYEFMDSEDEKIQYGLIDELKKYIYYGYDEETEMEYEYPEAKPIDTSIFNEFEGSLGTYRNADWGDEWLEITNSIIWGLSTSFPHVIHNYK